MKTGRYYLNKMIKLRRGRVFFECKNIDDPNERFNVSITLFRLRRMEPPIDFFSRNDIDKHFRLEA